MAAIGGDDAGPRKVVVVSLSGASHSEHDTDIPGAEAVSVRAGHEPDRFGVRSILAVPALLAALVLVAFGIVSAVFITQYTRFVPTPAGGTNPQALDINTVTDTNGVRTDRDVSERFGRIGSTMPKDVPDKPGTAVPQPRLEYLKQKPPETADDPAFERSKRAVDSPTNTYEIRPEDLRPDNYVDPVSRERALATYGWVDAQHTIARRPVAIYLAALAKPQVERTADEKKLVEQMKKVLPVRKDGIPAPSSSINTPTLSNGGNPAKPSAIQGGKQAPPTKPHDDHKH